MASFSAAAFSTSAFSTSSFDFDIVGVVQPILPISTPGFRSIDAKSIADVYNRGTADMEDYKFGNDRRFYQ